MTKKIRIENADNSTWPVKVEIWEKKAGLHSTDLLVNTLIINNPTDMVEVYVHHTQYIKVLEE